MGYATRHVCALFHVSPETARTWAEEFSKYLSLGANPGTGRHRQFSDDDMQVLSLVAEMKRNNRVYEEIHASLAAGQRGAPPPLPVSEVQALVVSAHEAQMFIEVQKLTERITELQKELEMLQPVRDDNIRLKARLEVVEGEAVKRITDLSSQLEKAQQEIKQLNREIGRLEAFRDEE